MNSDETKFIHRRPTLMAIGAHVEDNSLEVGPLLHLLTLEYDVLGLE